MALIQYLIIGLVTPQDKALNALGMLDEQARQRRQELIAEFELTSPATSQTASAMKMVSSTAPVPLSNSR